jgi:restriction system protein
MGKAKETRGPQFVRYWGPVVTALKTLGGSGRPAEVKDRIAEQLNLSEDEINNTVDSGASRFSNQVDCG